MERRKTSSAWTFEAHSSDGRVESYPVRVAWMGPFVTVVVRNPDGERVERHGEMKVQRVLVEGPRERLIERIVKVRVSSIFGDVVGEDRTMRGAAEDFASKVLLIEVDRRRALRRAVAS